MNIIPDQMELSRKSKKKKKQNYLVMYIFSENRIAPQRKIK